MYSANKRATNLRNPRLGANASETDRRNPIPSYPTTSDNLLSRNRDILHCVRNGRGLLITVIDVAQTQGEESSREFGRYEQLVSRNSREADSLSNLFFVSWVEHKVMNILSLS